MLKPIYGLKDAPRAWRTKLHQVLIQWLSCRQLYSGPELYCVHRDDDVKGGNVHERAQQHNEKQREIGNVRNTKTQAHLAGGSQCLSSVHVDDIRARRVRRRRGHCSST